ncbi:hypothetical protein GOBAR_AA35560 [Gossypium barbadense]|uniref:Uncharacterized protein n=1 Tax=Gossypium barbadense TaxID=3634 RepID=A0A2P5W248_GOSBA|nr:hypothetical protein GOBAR_AA35560 [Gossypium barbadense]
MTATIDGTAASVVRVSFSPWLTVIVGRTPSRAGHGVPLQSPVAYVPIVAFQYAPANLGLHLQLTHRHAHGHPALKAAALCLNQTARVDSERGGDEQCCEV